MLVALQTAVRSTLGASAALAALVGAQVFDRVPKGTKPPYVTIGEDQLVDDSASCIEAFEATVQIHCWASEPGFEAASRIHDAVYQTLKSTTALDNALEALGYRMKGWRYRGTPFKARDPDGLTSHIVIEFTGQLSPTA